MTSFSSGSDRWRTSLGYKNLYCQIVRGLKLPEETNLMMIRLFCRPIFRSSGQRGSAVDEVELSHTFTGFSQWHDINLDVGNGWALRHIVLSFSAKKRQRDNAKCYNQRNATRRRDKQTGLSTVFYKYSDNVDVFLVLSNESQRKKVTIFV